MVFPKRVPFFSRVTEPDVFRPLAAQKQGSENISGESPMFSLGCRIHIGVMEMCVAAKFRDAKGPCFQVARTALRTGAGCSAKTRPTTST